MNLWFWFFVISSKDSFVKFWDLDTQHCFLTLVGHRSEVSIHFKMLTTEIYWVILKCGKWLKICLNYKKFLFHVYVAVAKNWMAWCKTNISDFFRWIFFLFFCSSFVRGMFYYEIKKHMQKFRHFWRRKIYLKKSLVLVLYQAIQL